MKANRRSLFIKAGLDLFSRYGYRDVSVEDISRKAGLSVGTFYKYFRSKEAYYEQILGLIEREGVNKVQQLVGRLHSPENKLKAVYQFVVLGMRRYPILRGVLQGDERFLYPGFDVHDGPIGSLRSNIQELIAEILRDGARRGVFRPGLYDDAQRMVMALLDTVIDNLDDPEIERLARDMLRLMQRGLRRVIRLRRRDERLDRRLIQDDDELDWLET